MSKLRIEIFPDDLDLAVSFYCEVLGFALTRDEREASSPYVALQLGGVRLGAAQRPTVHAELRRPPSGAELVLEVDRLHDARQRVEESGWPIDEDITVRPWGLADFRIVDPFGYYWRITDSEPAAVETDPDRTAS